MNNVLMRRIALTEQYRPLSDRSVVVTVEISVPPTNAGPAFFLGEDDQDVPWTVGEWHSLIRVDLSEIWVKGTPGDIVTVIGGTW